MRGDKYVRFERYTTPEPTTGCLLWHGPLASPAGYGWMCWGQDRQLAHRFAWESTNRKLVAGECVLHKCDTPACVNPDHLYVGDKKQNALDRRDRRRGFNPAGDLHPRRKLSSDDVRRIRETDWHGMTTAEIGVRFGVVATAVQKVLRRQTWQLV